MLWVESDGIEDVLDLGINLVQDPEELAGPRKIDFGDADAFHRFQCLLGGEVNLLELQQEIQQIAQEQSQVADKDMGLDARRTEMKDRT